MDGESFLRYLVGMVVEGGIFMIACLNGECEFG